MRSGPVNLAAASATPEILVIDFGKRFEFVNHISFADFLKRRITTKTAREGSNRAEKIKTTDHLDGLFISILRTRAIAGFHNRMCKQAPGARRARPDCAVHSAVDIARS